MIRRWLVLTYYLYALRLAALSHFYFNPLYNFEPSNRIAACIKSSLHQKQHAPAVPHIQATKNRFSRTEAVLIFMVLTKPG